MVQFRETKAPTFPSWAVCCGPAVEVVNEPSTWPVSWSYRDTTTGVRPDSCAAVLVWMGVTTWTAVRPVPEVEVSVPFSVSPVPLPVEMALTKVSLPPCPVVRYRGSAVAPFVPAGRMFSSAPPGSRASSGVMVVVMIGELPLLYPVVVPALDIVVMPLLVELLVELMRSLCSCAPVIDWMWVCCCGWRELGWLEVKCDRLELLMLLPPVVR